MWAVRSQGRPRLNFGAGKISCLLVEIHFTQKFILGILFDKVKMAPSIKRYKIKKSGVIPFSIFRTLKRKTFPMIIATKDYFLKSVILVVKK